MDIFEYNKHLELIEELEKQAEQEFVPQLFYREGEFIPQLYYKGD